MIRTSKPIRILAAEQPQGAPCSPGVYKITSLPTGRFYIGSTANIRLRWYNHHKALRDGEHHACRMQTEWDRYGAKQFRFEVLEPTSVADIVMREQHYLDITGCCDPAIGFNVHTEAGRRGKYGKRIKLQPSDYDPIIAAYRSGESTGTIASRYRVSKATIRDVLRRCDIPFRPRVKYAFDHSEVIRRYDNLEKVKDIAKSLGVPAFAVQMAINNSNGAVDLVARRNRISFQRFWNRVNKTDGCWLWTGTVDAYGYGKFSKLSRKRRVAHRISWELANGPIPPGMFVLHKCPGGDNPRCVNPAHLWLATPAEKCADAIAKNQTAKQQNRCASKDDGVRSRGWNNRVLTDDKVREIRVLHSTGNHTLASLAAMFGVTIGTVHSIILRRTWKHVG